MTTVTVDDHLVKRLCQAEQEECCRLGLYYNCNEKYTRAQSCMPSALLH